jgi:predicted PurR-regulated permease PerM
MNRVISWFQSINLRQVITVFLTVIAFLVIPAFSYNTSVQAGTLIAEADSYTVDSATIKRIQQRAEDLGDRPDRPIGDTGLENIKELGENIPETLDLNARQGFFGGDPNDLDKKNAVDKVQQRVGGAVEGAKRAVKDAAS